jgi:diguanylate cyclase (GGDEF)-like protein
LRENEKKYKALSITDGLTELHNSRHFFSILKKEIERAKRYDRALSLILLDIDNFKQYNDQYGHMEGDRVLARLGRIILANLRDADSAYRYGGEEFTVLLPETDAQEAVTVAERIRKRIGAEVFSPRLRTEINKTVSIGIARYHPGEELSAFVKRADKAMYTAKQQGKNRTVFLDESHPEEHRLVQKGVKRKPETTIEYTLKPGY